MIDSFAGDKTLHPTIPHKSVEVLLDSLECLECFKSVLSQTELTLLLLLLLLSLRTSFAQLKSVSILKIFFSRYIRTEVKNAYFWHNDAKTDRS